jgi:drug/metabolite transporter superfamily protein YnfA
MANEFNTLHDFMVHSKGIVYVLMGGILIAAVLFWKFLTGREKPSRKY